MIKKMVENHVSVGGWFEPGNGLQGVEPKSPKIDKHTNEPIGTSPLGLTLTKTPSFLELIETKLSKQSTNGEQKIRKNKSQSQSEKLKASNIPALSLQIGSWKRVASYQGDLVAKCYFAKQKLVWEVLCEGLKSKMEIQWLQISAIRATFVEGLPDKLEIELQKPPTFFCESSPHPRKHTMWVAGNDFTGGQAQIYKRHSIQFPEGSLEQHYEKLLECDSRLYELSWRPFPNLNSPLFDMIPQYYQQSGIIFQSEQLPHQIRLASNLRNIHAPTQHIMQYQSISQPSNSTNFAYSLPLQTTARGTENLSVPVEMDPMASHSDNNIPIWNQDVQNMKDFVSVSQQAVEINSIAHQLLSEPQSPEYADEKSLLVKVSSFGSVLCELNGGAQVALTSENEGYNLSNPNKVYNRIKEAGGGVYNLSDPSSSMEPMVYNQVNLIPEGYMFSG